MGLKVGTWATKRASYRMHSGDFKTIETLNLLAVKLCNLQQRSVHDFIGPYKMRHGGKLNVWKGLRPGLVIRKVGGCVKSACPKWPSIRALVQHRNARSVVQVLTWLEMNSRLSTYYVLTLVTRTLFNTRETCQFHVVRLYHRPHIRGPLNPT